MLRSFEFNETVFRGPDTEGGGGDVENVLDTGGADAGGSDTPDSGDAGGEGGESTEPLTVREQIKKSIAETSEPAPEKKPRDKSGRFGDRKPKEQEAAPAEPVQAAPTTPAPDSLSKEAKAEWDKTPPAVQAAFVKREEDIARGVNELRQRYNLIDQAIAPHTDALRQMNATPADAVNRMFLWFKALAGKPADAFPALAQSMGIDWTKLIAAKAGSAEQAAAQGTASGGAPEIPDPVRNYVGGLERQIQQMGQMIHQMGGRFQSIEQNTNAQNEARTVENLSMWSKDKPHFQEVRQDMAKMIETGIVPLKDGQVDLDGAYERAIYFNPDVRAKVIAAQQQANTQVQQQTADAATTARQAQVGKARKASVSLPVTAPGSANGQPGGKKTTGAKLSVRDSLKASIAQLRDQ